MPINTKELLSVVSQITEHKRVRVTVTESAKGGLITGASATVGGLLLGPIGLAAGGVVGGCAAYLMSQDKFKSIPEVIMHDMTYAQRERLAASVNAVIADLRVEDAALLLQMILQCPYTKEAVVMEVIAFMRNEMQLHIVD